MLVVWPRLASAALSESGVPGCPDVPWGVVGNCREECKTDSDCPSGRLCCSNTRDNKCGHVCKDPEKTANRWRVPFTFRVVLTEGVEGARDRVVEALPKGSQARLLKGGSVLLVSYKSDKRVAACKARAILKTHEAVKSVENKGPELQCKKKKKHKTESAAKEEL